MHEPRPRIAGAPPRFGALAPLRVRSFRFQWPADMLTSWAFEMELLILGWYVLVETGSVFLLTLFSAILYIGTLVAPMFGVVGDRIGQRNLLCGMRAIYMLLAAAMAGLALTGLLTPLYVFIIAVFTGLVRPSDMGVRGALVATSVPADVLVSAMSLSRTTSDTARIMGALTGSGLFALFGIGPAYVAITVFYALGSLLLLGMAQEACAPRGEGAAEGPPPSPWRDLRLGMAHIWNTPRLLAAMWIAFLINLTAFPLVTSLMPYVAKEVYRTDQTGLGWLVASLALGALMGSLALSVLGERMRVEKAMLAAMASWFVMVIVFANTSGIVAGIACLVVTGVMQSVSMIMLAVLLMQTAAPQYRGRVMGVRMLAIYGHPLGTLAAGVLVEQLGYTATAWIYGAVGLSTLAAIVFFFRNHILHPAPPARA